MKISAHKLMLAAALTLSLGSCGSNSADTDSRQVAVSIAPQRWLVEQIAGDRFEVVTLMESSADPETFEPSMQRRMAIDRSAAFFTTGLLTFESNITSSLRPEVKVFNTSEGIDLIYGTHEHHSHDTDCDDGDDDHSGHSHHHDDGSADPHVWSSLRATGVMADNIAAALEQLDPENADVYKANLATLHQRLDSADASNTRRLADADAHAFAIWHPSLSYFARDYGLKQLAVDTEGKEISLNRRLSIIDQAKADSITTFFIQNSSDTRRANPFCDAIGAKVAIINPMGADIISETANVVDQLTTKP